MYLVGGGKKEEPVRRMLYFCVHADIVLLST